MASLNYFIQTYDNAINSDACDFLISLFDKNKKLHERVESDGKPNFTQINLTENCKLNSEVENVHNYLIKKTFEYRNIYYEHVYKSVFPEKHAFEQFRIKRYNTDGVDRFDTHVDVGDYSSARRFLAFMWYLNDIDEGGETQFLDLKIKPEKGTLLVFPPLWMFPHAGLPPKNTKKYIASTYLHYI